MKGEWLLDLPRKRSQASAGLWHQITLSQRQQHINIINILRYDHEREEGKKTLAFLGHSRRMARTRGRDFYNNFGGTTSLTTLERVQKYIY